MTVTHISAICTVDYWLRFYFAKTVDKWQQFVEQCHILEA